MVSMFATLAKQETARISERTIIELKTARAKGKRLGRPPVAEATIRQVLTLNQENALGARRIAKRTLIPLGTVNAILTRERKRAVTGSTRATLQLPVTTVSGFSVGKLLCFECSPHRIRNVLRILIQRSRQCSNEPPSGRPRSASPL